MRKLLAIIFAAIAVMAGCSRDEDGSRKEPEKPGDTIRTDTAHVDTTQVDTNRTDTTRTDTTRIDTVRTDTTQVDTLIGRYFFVNSVEYKVISENVVHVDWFVRNKGSDTLTIPSMVSYGGRQFKVTAVEFPYIYKNDCATDFDGDYGAYCNSNLVLSEGVDSIINMFPVRDVNDLWLPRTFKFFGPNPMGPNEGVGIGEFLNGVRIHIPTIEDWLAIKLTPSYRHQCPIDYYRLCVGSNSPTVDLEIPGDVSQIGEYAFAGNLSVRSVRISDAVTSIGRMAFHSCPKLESVVLPSGLEEISKGLFWMDGKLSKVNIPPGLKRIRNNAFAGCDALDCIITLPATIDTIFNGAFTNKLKTVYCLSKTPPVLGKESFDNYGLYPHGNGPNSPYVFGIDSLYVPRESVSLYEADRLWRRAAEVISPIKETRQGSAAKRPRNRR